MTLLDILKKAAGEAGDVKKALESVIEKFPDAAPIVQPALDALATAVPAEALVGLASALPGEILNIAQGKLEPREHPGDAI